MAFTEMKKIRYVVFDLDDTLYSESSYCRSGFTAVAKELSAGINIDEQVIYDKLWSLFLGGQTQRLFNAALDALGAGYDDALITRLVEVYRNHKPQITLPLRSKAVLDALKGRVKLGLLTDGYMPAQRLKVQALGIEGYFDKTVYTELLGRQYWKPAAEGFELIMRDEGFQAGEFVYIADNPAKDFIAPNKLGWLSVWYKNKDRIHKTAPQNEAERASVEIENLEELTEIINYGD